jgi:hypothetical protein
MTILQQVKLALRIVTSDFDGELNSLINAAKTDLGLAGVIVPSTLTDIVNIAIVTYCKVHFGAPDNYAQLKASYDEQKAQLSMAFKDGYTVAVHG